MIGLEKFDHAVAQQQPQCPAAQRQQYRLQQDHQHDGHAMVPNARITAISCRRSLIEL